MTEAADYLVHTFLIGVGATAVMDIGAAMRKWVAGSPTWCTGTFSTIPLPHHLPCQASE